MTTLCLLTTSLSASVHGRDDARHLLGGYASVTESQKNIIQETGPLGKAAFWIHQRQDVFNAIINQRLPRTDLDRSGLDRSVSVAEPNLWAKRATCLQAEVVSFCFGADNNSVEKFRHVARRLEEWDLYKPRIFTPVFYQDRDLSQGRFLPDICVLWDCSGKCAGW